MTETAPASPLLLVTGCVRSGTTILQRVLHRHPALAVTNELQVFVGLGEPIGLRYLRRVLRRGGRRHNRREVFRPDAKRHRTYLGNLAATARLVGKLAGGWRRELTLGRIERAYRALYPRAARFGDKSPTYVYHLDDYVQRGVACVVIYRDCRDVVASARRATQTMWRRRPHVVHLDSVGKITRRWVAAIEAMERGGAAVHVIRYEALIDDPRRTLTALGDWLGIDPDGLAPDLLHRASVGRHRRELSAADLAEIAQLAGPTMARLGYG